MIENATLWLWAISNSSPFPFQKMWLLKTGKEEPSMYWSTFSLLITKLHWASTNKGVLPVIPLTNDIDAQFCTNHPPPPPPSNNNAKGQGCLKASQLTKALKTVCHCLSFVQFETIRFGTEGKTLYTEILSKNLQKWKLSKFLLIHGQINQALNNPGLLILLSDELKLNPQVWWTLTLIMKLQAKYGFTSV